MIEILNLTKTVIDLNVFKKIAEVVLKEERAGGDLSIVLVESDKIKEFNRKYRNEDFPTDVLSFGQFNDLNFILPGEKKNQGEIILCPEQIKNNAEKLRIIFKKELINVLIHGILHVLGYFHEEPEESIKMFDKQKYYLEKCLKII